MVHHPHPDQDHHPVGCGILTLSDTRTPDTDRSGQLIRQALHTAGHTLERYDIITEEPDLIRRSLQEFCQMSQIQAVICNGGTGISPRDCTYDVLETLLEKTLPGFGELFRLLSYEDIGSRALASRAIAGVYQETLIFALPGSRNAVDLALKKLILPELSHLTHQLKPR